LPLPSDIQTLKRLELQETPDQGSASGPCWG